MIPQGISEKYPGQYPSGSPLGVIPQGKPPRNYNFKQILLVIAPNPPLAEGLSRLQLITISVIALRGGRDIIKTSGLFHTNFFAPDMLVEVRFLARSEKAMENKMQIPYALGE